MKDGRFRTVTGGWLNLARPLNLYGAALLLLVTRGVFISDDIGDNLAFCDFCAAIDVEAVVVEFEGKYVGALTRP